MSPLAIRRGDADPVDIAAGELQTNALQLNYDANTLRPETTDPWATGAGQS